PRSTNASRCCMATIRNTSAEVDRERGRRRRFWWDYCAGEMGRTALGVPERKVDVRRAMNETKQLSFPEELDQSEEAGRLPVWRLDQFTALGFDPALAATMADDSVVDLAQARRLIALGCPLETASRILL